MTAPTFGATLRGARLGFRWLDAVCAFVRVSGEPGRWVVELAHEGSDMPKGPANGEYRCWWETDGGIDALGELLTRRTGDILMRPKPPCRFIVNDEGEPVA